MSAVEAPPPPLADDADDRGRGPAAQHPDLRIEWIDRLVPARFSLAMYRHPTHDYVTSHFVHPAVLFAYRFACLAYIMYWDLRFLIGDGIDELRYFTNLNYTILMLYLASTIVLSIVHYFHWRPSKRYHATPAHMVLWCFSEVPPLRGRMDVMGLPRSLR